MVSFMVCIKYSFFLCIFCRRTNVNFSEENAIFLPVSTAEELNYKFKEILKQM